MITCVLQKWNKEISNLPKMMMILQLKMIMSFLNNGKNKMLKMIKMMMKMTINIIKIIDNFSRYLNEKYMFLALKEK